MKTNRCLDGSKNRNEEFMWEKVCLRVLVELRSSRTGRRLEVTWISAPLEFVFRG